MAMGWDDVMAMVGKGHPGLPPPLSDERGSNSPCLVHLFDCFRCSLRTFTGMYPGTFVLKYWFFYHTNLHFLLPCAVTFE
jgi:hypothetical protein